MATLSPTRGRGLQFGLGTMFTVMTAIALFLGHHLDWIWQRRTAIASWEYSAHQLLSPHTGVAAPGLLGLFGERGYGCLWREAFKPLSGDEERELARVQRLFPEAVVIWPVYDDEE
jgi:hypothetical protein